MASASVHPESAFPLAMMRFLEEWWGGLPHSVFPHPLTKVGRQLDFRIVAQGEPDRPVLLVTAGLHGVEGIAGLKLLTQWAMSRGLRDARDAGVTVVVIPTVNVFGASRLRRTDEDNVDLNRNFLPDWGTLPQNPAYSELHDALVPANWDEATRERTRAQLDAYIAEHGPAAYQAAVSGGQYTHEDGVFFGGTKPSWSNITLRRVLPMWLSKATKIVHIDLHTGLGKEFSRGYMICPAAVDDPMYLRAEQIWGKLEPPPGQQGSVTSATTGCMANAVIELLPNAEITHLALEFATHPITRVIDAMRAEAVWSKMGRPESKWGTDVQEEMLECFCPAGPAWMRACYEQFDDHTSKVFKALQ